MFDSQRITLLTGPPKLKQLRESIAQETTACDKLRAAIPAYDKELTEIRAADPTLPPTVRGQPWVYSLDDVQLWFQRQAEVVAQKDSVYAEIRQINTQIKPVLDQIGEINRVVCARTAKLSDLCRLRANHISIIAALEQGRVPPEYLEAVSREWFSYLEQASIPLSYADQSKQLLASHPRRWLERYSFDSMTVPNEHLSSTKTLAAISTELVHSLCGAVSRSAVDYFAENLKRANIKSVLEVGPGSRGIINLLIESGITERANLEMSAVDLRHDFPKCLALKDYSVDARQGNALELREIFPRKAFDLIVAVGVLSAGGMGGRDYSSPSELFYSNLANDAHSLVGVLQQALSANSHSRLVVASISGTLALQRDRFQASELVLWRDAPEKNKHEERQRVVERNARCDSRHYSIYCEKLIGDAADIVILKHHA